MHTTQRALPPLIKVIVDFGPLVTFFLANSQAGLMVATAAFMVTTLIALSITFAVERRLAPMPLITGVFVLIFGGLTLWLDNELFIKLKPTIVNLLFASILAAGLMTGRPLMKFLFQDAFKLTDEGWRKLTIRWASFFVFLAVLNEVVWRNFSTDFWVAFKVWGNIPITLIFAVSQVSLLTRYRLDEDATPANQNEG